MPLGQNRLVRVIERLGEDVQLVPLVSDADTDHESDGTADLVFGDPRTIRVRISAEDATEYARTELGQIDNTALFMTVGDRHDVSLDDRVLYDQPTPETAYRVTHSMPAPVHEFHRFILIEDDRDTGNDTTTGGPVSDPDEESGWVE